LFAFTETFNGFCMMRQMSLPLNCGEDEETSIRAARHERLNKLEAAAINCRIAWDEVGGRVLRALGHLCGSVVQQSRGISGLRWAGPVGELAGDKMVDASVARVRVVLKLLERLGIITKETHRNWRGQDCGVVITLEMGRVNTLAWVGNSLPEYPPNNPREYPPKYLPEYPPKYLPQTEHTLYSVFPTIPNTPPPSEESHAELIVDEPGQAEPNQVDEIALNRSAADFEIDPKPLRELEDACRSIGIERVKPFCDEFAARVPEALAAIATYRAQPSRFKSPGAVIAFLRSGAWSVSGVRDLTEIEATRSKAEAKRRDEAAERRRLELNKCSGFTDEEIAGLRSAGILI
jgi:hypothetical protein